MKSPGIQFLESLLTMARVVMTGAVLVAVCIVVVSINGDHLVYGHELMISIVVSIGSLFVVSTTQRLLGYTRGCRPKSSSSRAGRRPDRVGLDLRHDRPAVPEAQARRGAHRPSDNTI